MIKVEVELSNEFYARLKRDIAITTIASAIVGTMDPGLELSVAIAAAIEKGEQTITSGGSDAIVAKLVGKKKD